jgi:hypothetical protein
MGVVASIQGVLAVVYRFEKSSYNTPSGIAGIIISPVALSLCFAYGVKYANGELDFLVRELKVPFAYYLLVSLSALVAMGIVLARFKARHVGTIIAVLALGLAFICGGWAITTADGNYEKNTKNVVQIPNLSSLPDVEPSQ